MEAVMEINKYTHTQITIDDIENVLQEKVRPDLSQHGGDIQVTELKDGVLRVRLLGQCSNCPSAKFTMENLVEEELKEAFPQLEKIELISGVSDELIAEARRMLRQRRAR